VHVCRSIVPLRDADGAITHHIGMQTFSLVKDQGHTIGGSHAVQQMGGLTGVAPACTTLYVSSFRLLKGIWWTCLASLCPQMQGCWPSRAAAWTWRLWQMMSRRLHKRIGVQQAAKSILERLREFHEKIDEVACEAGLVRLIWGGEGRACRAIWSGLAWWDEGACFRSNLAAPASLRPCRHTAQISKGRYSHYLALSSACMAVE
jgi:hypothetical protein